MQLTYQDKLILLDCVLDDLRAEKNIHEIKGRLQGISYTKEVNCKKLYQALYIDEEQRPAFKRKIEDILDLLHIADKNEVQHDSLYQILIKQEEQGSLRAKYFLRRQIHQVDPTPYLGIIFSIAALCMAIVGSTVYLKNIDPLELVMTHAIPLLRYFPLFSITIFSASLSLAWYQTFVQSSTLSPYNLKKFYPNAFSNLLNVIGYSLCFLAGGVMTLPATLFFVGDATLHILKSLRQCSAASNAVKPADDDDWYAWEQYEILHNSAMRSRRLGTVKLVAALFTAAATILSCLFPLPIIMACCCVFTLLIKQAKHSLLSYFEDRCYHQLNTKIGKHYHLLPPDLDTTIGESMAPNENGNQEEDSYSKMMSQTLRPAEKPSAATEIDETKANTSSISSTIQVDTNDFEGTFGFPSPR